MKQLQFYKYATWGLLFLNLAMVAFFFFTAPPRHHGGEGRDGKNGAIETLGLDEKQHKEFLDLVHEHMKQMEDFNAEQKKLLAPYFNSLIDDSITINMEELLGKVPQYERKKVEATYQHFNAVKNILRPEQSTNFEEFVEHAVKKILLSSQSKRPPIRTPK